MPKAFLHQKLQVGMYLLADDPTTLAGNGRGCFILSNISEG